MAIEKISVEINSNIKDIEKQLSDVDKQLTSLSKKKTDLKINSSNLDTVKSKLISIQKEIQSLNNQKAILIIDSENITKTGLALQSVQERLSNIKNESVDIDVSLNMASVGQGLDTIGKQLVDASSSFKGGLDSVANMVTSLIPIAGAIKQIDQELPSDISSLVSKMANMAIALGGFSALGYAAAKLPKDTMTDGFKTINKASKELIKVAETMQQIDEKIPSNIIAFASKIANMAIALGGFGALGFVAGNLPKDTMTEGFKMINKASKELIKVAETMQQIDEKIPSNILEFASKIANMAIALGGFGTLGFVAGNLPKDTMTEGFKVIHKASKELILVAEAIGELNEKIPSNILEFASKIANMAIALGGFGILAFVAGNLPKDTMIDGFKIIHTASKELILVAEAIGELNEKIPSNILEFASKIANMAIALVAFGAIALVAGSLPKTTVNKGLAVIAAMSGDLMIVAEAIAQLDQKVPSNIQDFASKIANMAIALGGFGIMVVAVGALMATGIGAIIAGAGLATIALMALDLMLVADAIQQLDQKVPKNISGVKDKIKGIQEVMDMFRGGSGGLLGAISGLLGSAIKTADTLIITEMMLCMVKIGKAIEKLKEIKVDKAATESKIKEIFDVIEALDLSSLQDKIGDTKATESLQKVSDAIKAISKIANTISKIRSVNSDMVTGIIQNIEIVAESLSDPGFKEALKGLIDVDDIVALKDIVLAIEETTKSLSQAKGVHIDIVSQIIDDVMTIVNKINDLDFELTIEPTDITSITEIIDAIVNSTKELSKIKSVSVDLVNDIIDDMLEIVDKLKGNDLSITANADDITKLKDIIDAIVEVTITLGTIKTISTGIIETILDELNTVVTKLNESGLATSDIPDAKKFADLNTIIQAIVDISIKLKDIKTINPDSIDQAITAIADIAKKLSGEILNSLTNLGDTQKFTDLKNMIDVIVDISNKLLELQSINPTSITTVIDKLKIVISKLSDGDLKGALMALVDPKEFKNLKVIIEAIVDVSNKLLELQEINSDPVIAAIAQIEAVVKKLAKKTPLEDALTNLLETNRFTDFKAIIDTIVDISNKLLELKEIGVDHPILNAINNLKEIALKLGESEELGTAIGAMMENSELEKVDVAISTLVDIINNIHALEVDIDIDKIITNIGYIQQVLTQLNTLATTVNLEELKAVIDQFTQLVEKVNNFAVEFLTAGTTFADQFIKGFTAVDIVNQISAKVEELITLLQGKVTTMEETGKSWGDAIVTSFETAISELTTVITTQTEAMATLTSTFTTLGTSYGNALKNGFSGAISKLSTTISVSNSGVSEYYATGGSVGPFKPRGTDIIPAMLTPGEYVHNRKAVNTFGLGFMNRVNNLDVSGAFQSLVGRFNTKSMLGQQSTVVNNVTHDNHAKVNQYITSNNQNYSLRRANRYLKGI